MIKSIIGFLKWRKILSSSENYIAYLREKGIRIGENCTIYDTSNVIIDTTRPYLIEIGNNVEIPAKVTILSHGYDWSVIHHLTGNILGSAGKVKINDNVFIGLGSTILAGTEIGENTIIGAGSVVRGKLDANSVYAGVPAKKISTLEDYIEKREARQVIEATQLINEYYKVHHKEPDVSEMHEHFFLFENSMENLNDIFDAKLKLGNSYEISKKALINHKPLFNSYEELLEYAKTQRVL